VGHYNRAFRRSSPPQRVPVIGRALARTVGLAGTKTHFVTIDGIRSTLECAPVRRSIASPRPKEKTALSKSASRARLAEIIRKRSFGRGEITLASGRKSDFYFNLKPTMLDPEGAALLAELTYEALKDDGLDYVGGLEMGAVPLAGAIAQLSWIKGHPIAAFFVRKKPKEHGARLAVEGLAKGESLQGKRVVIVEDVTTTGSSALKAAEAVRDAGGEIALVFTMVDRDEGATETFAQAGIPFRSLYKAGEFLKG
jgi:orotate phosphoribosyltransferase